MEGAAYFDFNTIIPMPNILQGTVCRTSVDDALVVLGRADLAWLGKESLEKRMQQQFGLQDIEALKAKIEMEAFEDARRSIQAFEETGFANWYIWANANWGTKWNACGFEVVADEPGRYEFLFDTAWAPPLPVFEKMGEMFPALDFDLYYSEPGMEIAGEGTIR